MTNLPYENTFSSVRIGVIVAVSFCGVLSNGRAGEAEWLTALRDVRAKQAPVHVEWMVSRTVMPDPELAKAMSADYEQKIEAAKKSNDLAQAESVKLMSDQIVKPIAEGQRIEFRVNAYYVNGKRFVIEQTFSPDKDPIKLKYFCNGDAVCCVTEMTNSVEIKPHPQGFVNELLRGFPAFALPNREMEALKQAQVTVKTEGSTKTVDAHIADCIDGQLILDSSTSRLMRAYFQEGDNPALLISAPNPKDAVPVLHFDQFNGGKPQIQEEWRLISEQPIDDPDKVDTKFHYTGDYTTTDMTGPKPVVLSSHELLHLLEKDQR